MSINININISINSSINISMCLLEHEVRTKNMHRMESTVVRSIEFIVSMGLL